MQDSHIRSVIKAITWRMLGTMDTIFLSFLITGRISTAISIGVTEVFTKIGLFYLHERIWNNLSWYRNNKSRLSSLTKSISWRIAGTIDTILLSYFFSKEIDKAIAIGSLELFTKIAFYYLHERIWDRITWGRIKVV
ncbi:DUF2061 domain-containing protein [Chondrinema litorale]|uniref:DUF2061 domain-containing protein n=1 Tax=Chondrinema litorale TaxID=2994555 RepID=UPI0025430A30|nr:DUF2061 domain-containing protein [Chondrinema litorale]UZR96357.1 DUF2061 domain-containing protein [Chondrinema litorale]